MVTNEEILNYENKIFCLDSLEVVIFKPDSAEACMLKMAAIFLASGEESARKCLLVNIIDNLSDNQ